MSFGQHQNWSMQNCFGEPSNAARHVKADVKQILSGWSAFDFALAQRQIMR